MAVEEIARISPTARDAFHGNPAQKATRPRSAAVAHNLEPAQAKNRSPHLPQQSGPQFEPDHEQHHDDTDLREMQDIAAAVHETYGIGSDGSAGQEIPDHRSQAETLGQRHRDDGRQQIDERLVKSAGHESLRRNCWCADASARNFGRSKARSPMDCSDALPSK